MAGGGRIDSMLEASFRQRGQEALERARKVLHSGRWRFESRTAGGDEVQSCVVPGLGRVTMITAFYNCSSHTLRNILIDKVEEYPKWCDCYVKDSCRRVMVLGSDMDVTHQATTKRLGGLVSPRDWLSLRHWQQVTDESGAPETLSTGVAVLLPDIPAGQGGYVRGETMLSAYAIADVPVQEPGAAGAARCRLRFLCSVRLGGWLPHSIVERYVVGGLVDFTTHLRQRLAVENH